MISVCRNGITITAATAEEKAKRPYMGESMQIFGLEFIFQGISRLDLMKFVGDELWTVYQNGQIDFALPQDWFNEHRENAWDYVWSYTNNNYGEPYYIGDLPRKAARIILDTIISRSCRIDIDKSVVWEVPV